MNSQQLLDLSDWRYVEVWTLEEAAMLWAGIDPLDHENTRIKELGEGAPFTQKKKALLFQRAFTEAVCVGTLDFVDAWEWNEDFNGNVWDEQIKFPALPDPNKLIFHKTRVKQAAFMRWVAAKKILSYRQLHSKPETSVVVVQATMSALPKPDFRDPSNPRRAVELVTAMDVWEESSGDDYIDGVSPNPKQVAMKAIERHEIGKNLSEAAKKRISTLVNWKQEGGCNPTPGN